VIAVSPLLAWLLVAIVFCILLGLFLLARFAVDQIARGIQAWLSDERRVWP